MDHQVRALHVYKELIKLRVSWAGWLVLCCGPEAPASGIAPAACIAGAASLLVASDVHDVKKVYRRGEVDFIVNSLDEAVRALKNEVRRKRQVSVALVVDVNTALAEMLERGVQPDAFITSGAQCENMLPFIDRGMAYHCIEWEREIEERHGKGEYSDYFIEAATPTKLREIDARLLRLLPKDEVARRRWIERAAQYLRGSTDGRWAYLDENEAWLLGSEGFTLQSPEECRPTVS